LENVSYKKPGILLHTHVAILAEYLGNFLEKWKNGKKGVGRRKRKTEVKRGRGKRNHQFILFFCIYTPT
jgi:hypothetical protein